MTYQPEPGPRGQFAYLAGPMRGIAQFNFPAFHAGEKKVRELGYGVFNPAAHDEANGFDPTNLDGDEDLRKLGFDLRDALGHDLAFITQFADVVYVLPGWENSKGATAEVATANALGLPVHRVEDYSLVYPISLRSSYDEVATAKPSPVELLRTDNDRHVGPVDAGAPDEVRVTSSSGGQKGQKEARFSLIPPGPLRELAVLYARGGLKYTDDNWKKGYPWSLSYDALRRHLDLFWTGEDIDPEMGVKHLTNVAWHAFNLAWFLENKPEFDDRPSGDDYAGAEPTPQWLLDLAATRQAD